MGSRWQWHQTDRWKGKWEPMTWSKWSGSSAQWPSQKQSDDEKGEWKFVTHRKPKVAKKDACSGLETGEKPEKGLNSKNAAKAKRTFLEIILADAPLAGGDDAEKEQKKDQLQRDARADNLGKILELIGEDETMADYKRALEKDLALVKKSVPKQKPRAIQIEAKAAFIDREAKRLTELDKDIQKAQAVLAQRTAALEKERTVLAQLQVELWQSSPASGSPHMEVDSNLGELERKELELLRKLSANFKPDGQVADVVVSKRLAKDLEDIQRDLETKRRRTSAAVAAAAK